MIDWVISLVPWWCWLAAALVAVVAVWRVLGWQGALGLAAAIAATFGYGKGRQDAARDLQARRDRQNAQAAKDRKEVNDDVSKLDGNDLDVALDPWMRDRKGR